MMQKTPPVLKSEFSKLANHKSPIYKHTFLDSPRESAFEISESSNQTSVDTISQQCSSARTKS